MDRPTEIESVPCSVGAGTEEVTAVADEEGLTPGVWTDILAEVAIDAAVCVRKGQ